MSNATSQMEQIRKDLTAKEGKYLTFALGPEEYGLEILKVREIIGYMAIYRRVLTKQQRLSRSSTKSHSRQIFLLLTQQLKLPVLEKLVKVSRL